MKFLSFFEWREEGRKALPKWVKCHQCGGSGELEPEECGECGCTCGSDEEECERCEGTGKIRSDDLSQRELGEQLTRERYAEAIIADAKALAEWKAIPVEGILQEAGFCPSTELRRYSRFSDGELVVVSFEAGELKINPEGIH